MNKQRRLIFRSKLGSVVTHTVVETRVKLPQKIKDDRREWRDVLKSNGGLLMQQRRRALYLVGGYNSWDSRTKQWKHTQNPHFYGQTEEDAPLLGFLVDLVDISAPRIYGLNERGERE